MENWDPAAFKTLLRTTSQRLGQLQERKDSQGKQTRRDIATYLSQGNVALARARAAVLIQEDVMADLLEELEMLVGTVGNHVTELGSGGGVGLGLGLGLGGNVNMNEDDEVEGRKGGLTGKSPRLSPALVEAAASIIRAAPSTESKDLNAVRETLIQRLGPTFAQTASANRNNHVSPRVMQFLTSPPPTASKMDGYLANIARTYNVKWIPEPRREDLVPVISEILCVDAGSSPIVDLPRLREMCARGLVDNPPWVRPRIWRLLFGTLPILKTTWAKESRKQRDSYYDLVHRLLSPFDSLPSPTDPLSPNDVLLTRLSDSLFRVSPDLFIHLGNEPKCFHSGLCPLDPTVSDTIRIASASNIDKRLMLLRNDHDASETPEIRLESEPSVGSDLASPSPPSSAARTVGSRRQRRPTTLLPSKAYNAPPVHRAHLSALLRLLYIHSTLNPAVQSPHVPWLLVPLYSALAGETDEDEVIHTEADTFWLFEALVGEIAEMEEEDGGKTWTRKLSERLKWADGDLATSLHATGLDPALPHYSYRWLAPLLTQTLPLSSVFLIWDTIFARPMRTRDANPKLEHLVDICTALLIRARTPLFRLGKPGPNVPGLWTQEHTSLPPMSPLRPWELSDAFKDGIALLSSYPIDAAGGIDLILQTAGDLGQRRVEARDRERKERESVGFGARLTQQMWKGFTNQVTDGSPEEEEGEEEEEEVEEEEENDETGEHDDGDETETPAAPTLTSKLANTVWRGITNQSSMDDEMPSPPSPLSDGPSSTPDEEQESKRVSQDVASPTSSSQTSLWNYAGKLKDSDTIAAFSKVSTNWRAMALDAWRVRKESSGSASSGVPAGQSPPPSATSELAARQNGWPGSNRAETPSPQRGSLPRPLRGSEDASLDPPRPTFFRSPRESFLPQPRRQYATAPSSPSIAPVRDSDTESVASSFLHRAGTSLASLKSLQSSPAHHSSKSVPRPLMLNSRDLITTKSSSSQPSYYPQSRSEGATPEQRGGQWGDILSTIKNGHGFRQESVSSTSSLFLPEAASRLPRSLPSTYAPSTGGTGPRSDYESDGSAVSRKVPLNRRTVSPMALASRSPRLPWNAISSPGGGEGRSSTGHPLSNGSITAEEAETASERGWRRHFEGRDQPTASTTMAASTAAGAGTAATTGSTGFDSPTTIGSPPIPHTPLIPAFSGLGAIRIANGEGSTGGGGHVGTNSISTLSEVSEASVVPLEPPTQARLLVRKTPPPPLCGATTATHRNGNGNDRENDAETLASESEESGFSVEMERTPSGKASMRIRSKRYVSPRPLAIDRWRSRPAGVVTGTGPEQRTPSPNLGNLAPDWQGDNESATTTTPKMENYRYSGVTVGEEGEEVAEEECVLSGPAFVRKTAREARLKKVSTGTRETRRTRDSDSAEEGDDEGYDELLSAYESEEGSRE